MSKNKTEKQLIDRFNRTGSLLVVSSYPPRVGEAAKLNAVACYTGNLLKAYKNRKVVVLAEMVINPKTGLVQPELYRQGGVLVYRCFDRDSQRLYWQLLHALHIFNQPRDILVQFEFNMFGALSVTGMLPFFLMALRLIGRKVTVVQHQVVASLGDLSGHLGIKAKSVKMAFMNTILRWYYRLLGWGAHRVIVHEEILKKRLSHFVPARKVAVISHGLSIDALPPTRAKVRRKLGYSNDELVVLLFGYLTWYKGTDWIIKQVGRLGYTHPELKVKLLVAGGESATLSHKPHYRKFLARVQALAAKYSASITMTGFVPENKVADYFSAADLVALPYRAMMSASGPLSFALRFGKPVIMSRTLRGALRNEDARQALRVAGMTEKDVVFTLSEQSFARKMSHVATRPEAIPDLTRFTKLLAEAREWQEIVCLYETVMAGAKSAVSGRWARRLFRYFYWPWTFFGRV